MPEPIENENLVTRTARKRNERTEAAANTSGEQLDNLIYLDTDSLINACISAKSYLKSKYGTTGQLYLNIAKTRFILPSRLRKKK